MEVAISQLALLCSVGRLADQGVAAIRAGVSRPHPIDTFPLVDPHTQELIPLIGHPIRGYAEGFNLLGYWRRTASGVLDELKQKINVLTEGYWRETALILALPFLVGGRFQVEQEPTIDLKAALMQPLCRAAKLAIAKENMHVCMRGHVAAIEAMILARQLIANQCVRQVLVIATDSYLDSLTLEWLATEGRLKCPENPTGLAPGEAAAGILVEGADCCSRPLANVDHLEVSSSASGENRDGEVLSRLLRSTVAKSQQQFGGDIVCDQNGELWRAKQLSGARLLARDSVHPNCRIVMPAISIGDTGAASAAVSLIVAATALYRGYASSEKSIVLASSECGDLGAAMLSRT
ncbi:MAG: hypothetical protein R3C53_26950 [Pirellulaceae bacterium]